MANGGNNQRIAARTRKIRARNSRYVRIFLVVIALVIAFVGGFLVRGNTALLQTLGFSQTITGAATKTPDAAAAKKDVFNALSVRVAETEDILSSDSLNGYDLSEVTEATLAAFADATGDSYVRYYSPSRYESLLNDQNESYAGVGVLFSEYNGQAYVVDVFEGSQSQAAGIREGDFVVAIDGDRSQTWSRSEVAAVLSQKNGSSVVITWRRPESFMADGGEERTTTLDCREYEETNISTDYDSDEKVGYIKVRQFTQNSATLASRALTELEQQGARAYVLDLRDNPGGYLSQAVDIASLFMSAGTVVEVQTKDGNSVKGATGNPKTTYPLVVLVNKNTAAAAEVVAAALKESQRATLVGVTTLGKGSVQVLHELSFGGALRYTAAYYMTPQGHTIDQVGVSPNVTVENDSSDIDSQLNFAHDSAAALVTED